MFSLIVGLILNVGPEYNCVADCINIPNSAEQNIVYWNTPFNYYARTWNTSVVVDLNGDVFTSLPNAVTAGQETYTGIVLTDSQGNTITVSATWSSHVKCGSGHAGGCQTVWNLVSGTVTE